MPIVQKVAFADDWLVHQKTGLAVYVHLRVESPRAHTPAETVSSLLRQQIWLLEEGKAPTERAHRSLASALQSDIASPVKSTVTARTLLRPKARRFTERISRKAPDKQTGPSQQNQSCSAISAVTKDATQVLMGRDGSTTLVGRFPQNPRAVVALMAGARPNMRPVTTERQ